VVFLHCREFADKWHEGGRFDSVVVIEPEAPMAPIPGEGEIARADEFAGFTHDAILP